MLHDAAREKDLVTWHPTLAKDGTLDLPTAPGIGCDLNLDVIRAHPYQEGNYLPLYEDAWNKREGKKASKY